MPKTCEVNEKSFEYLKDNITAYWLGFIAADGYIYSGENSYYFGIGLAKKDFDHLKKLNQFIHSNYKISDITSTESKTLKISNPVFCDNLKKWGIEERKSYKNKTLFTIPDNRKDSFIAGFFDGDGSIFEYIRKSKYKNKVYKGTYYRVQIDGNKKTLEDIKKFLSKKYDFSKIDIIPHGSIFRIFWDKKSDIIEFYKLYNKSEEKLERKKEMFNKFLQVKGGKIEQMD